MRILLSPAKKMRVDTDSLAPLGLPVYLEQARELMHAVQSLSLAETKALWKCNDQLAELNYERFAHMDLERQLTPADYFIMVEFCEQVDGKLKQKGTFAKMARGEMVRFLAEHQVEDPTQMRDFTGMGYRFDEDESDENTYVFVARREKEKKHHALSDAPANIGFG